MKLEDEIRQSEFKNEFQKLIINLIYTHGWLNQLNSQRLKIHGITPQQYNILRIVRGQHPQPATVQLVQERMLDRMSNASRLVEKLRLKGLVERQQCPHDRRAVDITITETGLELLHRIDNQEAGHEKKLHTLTKEEAIQLNNLLDKLRG